MRHLVGRVSPKWLKLVRRLKSGRLNPRHKERIGDFSFRLSSASQIAFHGSLVNSADKRSVYVFLRTVFYLGVLLTWITFEGKSDHVASLEKLVLSDTNV